MFKRSYDVARFCDDNKFLQHNKFLTLQLRRGTGIGRWVSGSLGLVTNLCGRPTTDYADLHDHADMYGDPKTQRPTQKEGHVSR
jgi:hypothetical protein